MPTTGTLNFSVNVFAPSDVVTSFGALTAAGAGGVSVTGTSISSGDASGHWQISGGKISPSSTGDTANLSGGPYLLVLDNGQQVYITIDADTYTAATVAEMNAAISAASASGSAKTVKLRNGDYATLPTIGNHTGKKLTLTYQDTRRGPRFANHSGFASGTPINAEFNGLSFYRSAASVAGGVGATDLALYQSGGNNITMRDCHFYGDALTPALLNDTSWNYPDSNTKYVPTALNFTTAGQNIVVEDCLMEWTNVTGIPLVSGAILRNCTFRYIWNDAIHITENLNTNGGKVLVENVTIEEMYARYDEQSAGFPHPDLIQVYRRQDAGLVTGVDLTIRRVVGMKGVNRGNGMQCIFIEQVPLDTVLVDGVAMAGESLHGLSYGGDYDDVQVMCVNSTFVNQNDFGTGSGLAAQFRINLLGNGVSAVAVNSIFRGPAFDNSNVAVVDDPTIEIRNSAMSADPSGFVGPLNPDTVAEFKAGFSPSSGNFVGQGAFENGDWRAPIAAIPRPAAAPTLADNGSGNMSVTRAVPSDLDGATVASYELRYRVNANNQPWTTVSGISSPEIVSGLSTGTYAAQTRPITSEGYPGFWSREATVAIA